MKSFTIENETNNITAHATKQDAELVAGAECFTSEAGLASLANDWPSGRLIEIWNSLPGATHVRKFKDRKTAVSRIWKAIQNLGDTAIPAPKSPRKAKVRSPSARAKASARRTRELNVEPGAANNSPREGSKTGRVIELLKRKGGVTLKELMIEMGWQAHTTRALLSAGGSIARKYGLKVVSAKGANGDRTYSIDA
jgi:hypothetical protein